MEGSLDHSVGYNDGIILSANVKEAAIALATAMEEGAKISLAQTKLIEMFIGPALVA